MILVDFSGVSLGNIVALNLPPDENLLRHTILNSLRACYSKHKAKYGQMVLCCDSSTWRRSAFEPYKYSRRAGRTQSDEDKAYWKAVFEVINTVREEIKEFLPWKVIHVDGAEADDVIAVLTESTQEFGRSEDILIWAADSDFKQLQRHSNVKQYSPQQKKAVTEKDPHRWLFEAIVTGQGGKDGIPNIRTDDEFFVRKVNGAKERQKMINQKTKDLWWENRNDLQSVMTEDEYQNFLRNRRLIDFNYIPMHIGRQIMEDFDNYDVPNGSRVLTYLASKRCRQLMEKIEDFR